MFIAYGYRKLTLPQCYTLRRPTKRTHEYICEPNSNLWVIVLVDYLKCTEY